MVRRRRLKYKTIPGPWPEQIGHSEFVRLLEEHLPEVHSQIDEYDAGLLHCEMAVLEQAALHAYNERLNIAKRYFDFANEVLKRADAGVLNAIQVSFLEGFVLGSEEEQGARAWMPEEMQIAFDKYKQWYAKPVEKRQEKPPI